MWYNSNVSLCSCNSILNTQKIHLYTQHFSVELIALIISHFYPFVNYSTPSPYLVSGSSSGVVVTVVAME